MLGRTADALRGKRAAWRPPEALQTELPSSGNVPEGTTPLCGGLICVPTFRAARFACTQPEWVACEMEYFQRKPCRHGWPVRGGAQ